MPTDSISPNNQDIHGFREELKDLGNAIKGLSVKSKRLETVMILLSVVQLIVAVMQFIQSFAFSNDTRTIIWGITMVVITAIVFAYLSKKIFSKK